MESRRAEERTTHIGKGVSVAVGVDGWHDVDVEVGKEVIIGGAVREEFVDHVRDGCGGDPLTRVDACRGRRRRGRGLRRRL